MATITDVRNGIKTALAGIKSLRVYTYWPGTINTDCLLIKRVGNKGLTTFASNGAVNLELTLIVPLNDIEQAQQAIEDYTDSSGSKSILAKLWADKTLDSSCQYFLEGDWGEDTAIIYPESGPEYMSAVLPLEVHFVF